MSEAKMLPLGSIVILKGNTKKMMIIARLIALPVKGQVYRFDYGACLYPEGMVGDSLIYFNQEDILKVVQEGYTDDDNEIMTRVYTTDLQGPKGKNTAPSPVGDYRAGFRGTSAACPQVAGIAALILSVNPNLYEHEVRSIIEMTCRKLDRYEFKNTSNHPSGTWNREVGYGLVDAEAAVQAATCTTDLSNTNVSANRFVRSCQSNFSLRNVTVTNNAKLTVRAVETSVDGIFNVTGSGCQFEIR